MPKRIGETQNNENNQEAIYEDEGSYSKGYKFFAAYSEFRCNSIKSQFRPYNSIFYPWGTIVFVH
jgi:hypothetical protein